MTTPLLLRRFVQVLLGAFVVIAASHLLRGRGLPYALTQGAVWALLSACLFVAAAAYRARKGQSCALCDDAAGSAETPTQR